MKNGSIITRLLFVMALTGISAPAAILSDFTSLLTAADPTQLGRLSRNGVAQDWDGDEAFSGVINTTTVYNYTTYSIDVGVDSFIQIDMDSLSANTFASAYLESYTPGAANGFQTNWLGDAGSSGNLFGTDPIFFQVQVPVDDTLVVVVNTTGAGGLGLGDPYHLTVEGYIDSSFDDAPPTTTPEPSTACLFGGGLLLAGALAGRRRATK
jgi:PEP-CTERM motif